MHAPGILSLSRRRTAPKSIENDCYIIRLTIAASVVEGDAVGSLSARQLTANVSDTSVCVTCSIMSLALVHSVGNPIGQMCLIMRIQKGGNPYDDDDRQRKRTWVASFMSGRERGLDAEKASRTVSIHQRWKTEGNTVTVIEIPSLEPTTVRSCIAVPLCLVAVCQVQRTSRPAR